MATESMIDQLRRTVLEASDENEITGIRAAARIGEELSVIGEQLSAIAAAAARRAGLSWQKIIETSWKSRNAGPAKPGALAGTETFAPKVWRALAAASALASGRGHDAVRGADLWSGMLTVREGSAATIVTVLRGPEAVADALQELKRTNARAEQQVVDGPPIFDANGGAGVPPCSDEVVAQFDAALAKSRGMGHDFVGTEHLMLAMLDDEGPNWEGKEGTGLKYAEARAELLAMLNALGIGSASLPSEQRPEERGGA